MAAIRTTWIVLVVVTYFTPPAVSLEIYGVDLARRLRDISEKGLGQDKIQKLFDTKAIFHTNVPNGKETVQMLASSLGERLNYYNEAIRAFQLVLIAHYNELIVSTNTNVAQKCCKVSATNLEYREEFKSKTDIRAACIRHASNIENTSISIPNKITEVLRENNRKNDNLAWQYFGSETGLTLVYPLTRTSDCNNYDPRSRSWYAEANAPTPKDIVVIFESTSGKMTDSIKQAVAILINTTNPNDRITVIAMSATVTTYIGSSEYSPCYSKDLALATPLNRNAFLKFVNDHIPSDRSVVNYFPAVDKAFDYFKGSDEGEKRSKLLVFMTSRDPSDVQTSEEIIEKIQRINKPGVVIQTYAFGLSMSKKTRNILQSMAENTGFKTKQGTVKKGTYTAIDPDTELRVQLHSYYNIFADSTNMDSPLITMPYFDRWGLGLVISLCLPVHSQGLLHGVACVDVVLEDIFFNITYYPQSSDTYVFIIDSHGRMILHPSLPKPIDVHDDPVFVDIATIERDKEATEIITSMKSGGNGTKAFFTHRGKPGSAEQATSLSRYFWMKVPHTDYSLCIVLTDNDGTVKMQLKQNEEHIKYLHPNSLVRTTEGALLCKHDGVVATTDGSVVMFTGAAYRWLTGDVSHLDENQYQRYNNYFKLLADDQVPAFKKSTQSWVTLSGLINEFWKHDLSTRYNSIILWRHLVTASGVLRIYPGTLYSRYDPSMLAWYKLATLNPESLIMGHTGQDNINLIISQAIFKGSPNSYHSSRDLPVAVVAGEIKATFVNNMLEDLYPACKEARCFIIDQSGSVLAHTSYSNAEHKTSHLITMEPAIARHLRDSGQMVQTSCLDFENYKTISSWTLTLKDYVITSESPRFELHDVRGTNLFVGIAWSDASIDNTACDCQNVTRCLQVKDDKCQCSCYETLRFNFCNNTLPTSKLNSVPLCPLENGQFEIIQRIPNNSRLTDLDPCFVSSCNKAHTSSECLEEDACSWCQVEGQHAPACHDTSQTLKCLDPIITTASAMPGFCVPLVVIFGLLNVLFLILLFLLYQYKTCCPCVHIFQSPDGTKNTHSTNGLAIGNTSNVVARYRAPARPPENSNTDTREAGLGSVHLSIAEQGRTNDAYNDNNIYESVDHETEQDARREIEVEDREVPIPDYLQPRSSRRCYSNGPAQFSTESSPQL